MSLVRYRYVLSRKEILVITDFFKTVHDVRSSSNDEIRMDVRS